MKDVEDKKTLKKENIYYVKTSNRLGLADILITFLLESFIPI